ncbi:PH-like domain-containing protein [Arthrobacter sp. TMN-49]
MDERILPGILTLLIVGVAFALMWWGWRNKLKRQGHVGELPAVPADLGAALISVPGQYVVTTSAGDWLDRLAVHGLGIRTPAVVNVYNTAVVLERKGGQSLFIAAAELTDVGTKAGMAGKFVEKDGLVVISWRLAGTEVDTGFRTAEAGAKRPLLEALAALLPQSHGTMAENDVAEGQGTPLTKAPFDGTETPAADSNGKNN